MKSFTAIFLASLCIYAHATSVYESPAFLEFKSQAFGSSLTSFIQLNMASQDTGRLDAISKALDTIAVSLDNQLQSNENTISEQRGWCADTKKQLNGQLGTANSDLDKYTKEQNENGKTKDQLTTTQNQAEKDLSTNKGNLEVTQKSLDDENTRNQGAVKDYAEAIAACEQSLTLLNTLRSNPASFIQTKTKFGNVVVLLEKHLANQTSPLVAPVISILTELASSSQEVDQEKLAKITQLITQLLNELRNQQASNVVRHETTVRELTSQIESLSNLIQDNQSTIEKTTSSIQQINNRQDELIPIIANLNSVIQLVGEELQRTNDTCSGYEQTYSSTKVNLEIQVSTLQKVRDYFNLHIVPSVEKISDEVYQDNLSR